MNQYVKSMGGLNPEAVDQSMFKGLTEELKKGVDGQTRARGAKPKSSVAESDDVPFEDMFADADGSDDGADMYDGDYDSDGIIDAEVEGAASSAGCAAYGGMGEESVMASTETGADSSNADREEQAGSDYTDVAFTDKVSIAASDEDDSGTSSSTAGSDRTCAGSPDSDAG
jgi:hypothetical protein